MGKNGRRFAWLAVVLAAVTAVLTACGGGGGYATAYVVGETYCPGDVFATCVVMSDGDVVGPVGNSVLSGILYGMVLSPYGGGYRFTRQPSSVTNVSYHRITVVQPASSYAGRRPVAPAAEASAEKTGDTYNAGGRSYPRSPAAVRSRAAVQASKAAAARYAKQQREPQDDVPAGYRKQSGGSAPKAPAAPRAPARVRAGK